MTDNSNTSANSSLFGDFISDTPASTPPSNPAPVVTPEVPVSTEDVSDTTLDSVLSAIREPLPAVPVIPIPDHIVPVAIEPIQPEVVPAIPVSPPSTVMSSSVSTTLIEEKISQPETIVPAPTISSVVSTISVANPVAEILTPPQPAQVEVLPQEQSEIPATIPQQQPVKNIEDTEKLRRYMEQDVIYNSMLRVVDPEQIRLRLAIRYMIMMFAVFLVAAWVVNNRVIMFGFSEFQLLARIRDALFGMIAGLFSVTLWFGSEAWFRRTFMIMAFRCIAVVFFVAVLSALYFPLW